MSLKDDLLKFVREDLVGSSDPNSIDENEPLIDGGYIDSMGLMQLTTFIEERTGVRIPDDEVVGVPCASAPHRSPAQAPSTRMRVMRSVLIFHEPPIFS